MQNQGTWASIERRGTLWQSLYTAAFAALLAKDDDAEEDDQSRFKRIAERARAAADEALVVATDTGGVVETMHSAGAGFSHGPIGVRVIPDENPAPPS